MDEHTDGLAGSIRQIKSKERVATHGEVITAPREVNAMLDLVKPETERIEARFLEPACGNGNFLAEILRRTLAVVGSRYGKCRSEYGLYSLIAIASLYGIDILKDNVEECRMRLFAIFEDHYRACFPSLSPTFTEQLTEEQRLFQSLRFILRRNILWGDALTLCTPDEVRRPIVFSEWSVVGQQVKRRDFTLDTLLRNQPMEGPNLFSDLGDEAFIPLPIREFPLMHYLDIGSHDDEQL